MFIFVDPNYLVVDIPNEIPTYGDDFSLLCVVPQESPYSGLRPIWLDHHGQRIAPIAQADGFNSFHTEQATPQSTRVVFRNLQQSSSGTYTCVVGPVRYRYDLIVELPACYPLCKNDGTCFNGICVCPIGLTGDICDEVGEFIQLLLILIFTFTIVVTSVQCSYERFCNVLSIDPASLACNYSNILGIFEFPCKLI